MKFLAVLFFVYALACANAGPIADDENLADEVRNVIDTILNLLPKKVAITGVEFDIPENDLLGGTITINELSVSDINSPSVEIVEYDDATSRLDYELNFDGVGIIVDLQIHFTGIIELTHQLTATFQLTNLDGKGFALIKHSTETEIAEVTEFQILVHLDDIQSTIRGLLDDDEISQVVEDEINTNGAQMIDDLLVELSPGVSELLTELINMIIQLVNS